jgi:succinate dehydrogenase / fumarate reductase cytochrome b subunit
MGLAGLFLISFLLVHLSINLLILFDDSRLLFNEAAHFMGTNLFIQAFQWVLFAGFAIHIIIGFILQIQNWIARPVRYKKRSNSEESIFSKFMFHTGIVIGVFLVIHLLNFFVKKMSGTIPAFEGGPYEMEDMGLLIVNLFSSGGYVAFYVLAILFLGFHLDHAFQSAMQSIGLSNDRWMKLWKAVSRTLAIVITLGFISIPLVIYFK